MLIFPGASSGNAGIPAMDKGLTAWTPGAGVDAGGDGEGAAGVAGELGDALGEVVGATGCRATGEGAARGTEENGMGRTTGFAAGGTDLAWTPGFARTEAGAGAFGGVAF